MPHCCFISVTFDGGEVANCWFSLPQFCCHLAPQASFTQDIITLSTSSTIHTITPLSCLKSAAPGAARSSLRSIRMAGRSTGGPSNTDQASLSLSSPTGPVQVQFSPIQSSPVRFSSSSVRPSPSWHTAQRKQRAVSSQCAQHRAAQFVSHPGIWKYAEQRTAFERCCDSTVKDVEEEYDETTDNEWMLRGSIQWDQR